MKLPSILNISGRTGAGKSKLAKSHVIEKQGRHLYVVPSKVLVREVTKDLEQLRDQAGAQVSIHPFDSSQNRKGGGVTKRIKDRVKDYQGSTAHCVFVITQASFLLLDTTIFDDWDLHLDELLVNGVMSGELYAPASWCAFAALYELKPVEDANGEISTTMSRIVRRDGVDPALVRKDPRILKEDKALFERCGAPYPVIIEAKSFEDTAVRKCRWYSAWTLEETKSFASVEIAACDLEESLGWMLSSAEMKARVVSRAIPSAPSKARIDIKYFDNGGDTCSAKFWETDAGKRNLMACAKHIAKTGIDFWSCNDTAIDFMKPLMPKTSALRQDRDQLNPIDGTFIPQRQEGTNFYGECTSCAMFLSSKAQDHEEIFARIDPAVTRAAISKSREGNLLWQFAGRGAPRNADFSGSYTIYVYDVHQAIALADRYKANGYPSVDIQHIKLDDFADRVREKPGPKPIVRTPKEEWAHVRQQSAVRSKAYRKRKKASGDEA